MCDKVDDDADDDDDDDDETEIRKLGPLMDSG